MHPLEAVDGLRIPCRYSYKRTWSALLALGGHGKSQFATQTQYLIDQFPTVELVVYAGAAGCLDPTVSIGDVVVGTTTIEHDYRLQFESRPLPRFAGHSQALEDVRQAARHVQGFITVFGVIASGDEDVVSSERATAIRDETGAVCVAWEGSGAGRAAAFNDVGATQLRAITDTADKEASRSFETHFPIAMHNLAMLLIAYLEHRQSQITVG